MAAKEIFEIRLDGSHQGQRWNIVLHYRQKVEDTGTALQAANHAQGNVAGILKQLMSSEAVIHQSFARQLTPQAMDTAVSTDFPNQQGEVASVAFPSFVSVICQLRTGFSSRRRRGRFFMPAIPRTHVEQGKLTTAAATEYTNKLAQLKGGFDNAATPFELVILSRADIVKDGKSIYNSVTPVTAMSVNHIVGTQRRRLYGRGT